MARVAKMLEQAQAQAARGEFADAKRSCERVLQRAPALLPALRLKAMLLVQQKQSAAAVTAFRRVLARDPNDVESLANLAGLLAEESAFEESIALLERAVALSPRWAALHFNLGNALSAAERPEVALGSFDQALRLEPAFAAAHNNRGSALKNLDRLEEAQLAFDAAVRVAPDWPVARSNLGMLLAERQQFASAIPHLWRACELEANGDSLAALSNAILRSALLPELLKEYRGEASASDRLWDALATRYLETRELPSAAIIWSYLLERAESGLRWSNLGLVSLLQGYETGQRSAFDVAIKALERALELDPSLGIARIHLASALKDSGRSDEALRVLELQSPFTDPGQALGAATLLELRAARWDWTEYGSLLLTIATAVRDHAQGLPPMGILVRFDDLNLQRLATRQYLTGLNIIPVTRVAAASFDATYVRQARLRIGYLSADFRDHPVAHALAGVIEAHDRSKVEVVGISTTAPDGSPISQRIRAAFDRCVDAVGGDIAAQESLIRNLGLDLLIDLGGLTAANHLRLLARRPAPVQASYLGYAATCGAAGIDYLIADQHTIPHESAEYYDECIVWLPDTSLPGEELALQDRPISSRAAEGLPAEGFVFCNFNQPVRLNPESFDVFLDILSRVPRSVLWLRSPGVDAERRLRDYSSRRGLDPLRLVFAGHTKERAAHLERLRLGDLYLDTLPYNAHTTGRDALAVDVPLLTCSGTTFAARVATSLLHSLGLHELVTHGRQEFIDRAVALAHAPAALAEVRARLAAARHQSAAFSPTKQAQQLECAFAAITSGAQPGVKEPLDLATATREQPIQRARFVLPASCPNGNIVWIASYPKSGNTWVRFLVSNLIYGPLNSAAELNVLAPDIHEQTPDFFAPSTPVLLKTHFPFGPRLPYADKSAAAIYVVRHPGDVLVSNYYYAQRSGGPGRDASAAFDHYFTQYLTVGGDPRWAELGMGHWSENVASWSYSQVAFPRLMLRYEDLSLDTGAVARKLCTFLGLARSDAEIDAAIAGSTFDRLRAIEEADIAARRIGIFYKPYLEESFTRGNRFMRAGGVGDAAKHLSRAQRQAIAHAFNPLMQELGYD